MNETKMSIPAIAAAVEKLVEARDILRGEIRRLDAVGAQPSSTEYLTVSSWVEAVEEVGKPIERYVDAVGN